MEHISRIPQLPVVRFLIAALIVGGFAFYSAPVPVRLGMTYYVGAFLPGLGLAVLVGWLAWSSKWFWRSLWVGLVLCALAQVGLFVYEVYQLSGRTP